MAESKFLKYQDKNRDGVIDVCETNEIEPVNNCPPCKRNPNAITPDWKKKDETEPWFNEKYCTMQVTVVTTEESLYIPDPDVSSPESAKEFFYQELFSRYEDEAIEALFDNFNKLSTRETKEQIRPFVEYTKYYLNPRPGSVVKLLFTIPIDNFALIQDAPPPSDDEDAQDSGSPVSITYSVNTLFPKLMKFRKAMYLYSRYYRVFTALEGGMLYFENGSAFTINKFDNYGDPGFFVGNSRMADILKDLDNWLNSRGYNLFLANAGGDFRYLFSDNNVIKFTMEFSPEYELKKLKIFTTGCREKPITFNSRALTALNSKDSFKDPTAMAYFTKLNEMEAFLSARVARPWLEFIQEHTYPKVSTEQKYPTSEQNGSTNLSALSCVADSLLEEGKQLGQDIVDDIFSLGDAIAYQFHKTSCKRSLGQINTELEEMGLVYKIDPETGEKKAVYGELKDSRTGKTRTIKSMAMAQAFEQLEDSDQPFASMCAALLGASLPIGTSSKEIINILWKDGLGRIKLCGLLDIMVESIQCLFKGLTLEQALKVALKSALKTLPLENWGDLFVGLPPSKQAELDALVKKKLNRVPTAKSPPLDRLDRSDDDVKFFGKIKINKPWQDEKLLERSAATKSYGNYDNEVRQSALNDPDAQKGQRTLVQKYDKARKQLSNPSTTHGLSPDVIMEAYTLALIDVYGNDLLSLVDMLNKYPGAQIIAKIIAVFDCPSPPMFDPNFLDFIKSVELPFCRNIQEVQLPMLQNPFGWFPTWADFLNGLYEAILLAVQTALLRILFRILVKVCELLGDAICKALEVAGDLVTSLPDLATGRDNFSNIIRDSICGPNASQEQVDATIADMFAKFGMGGAAFSNTEKIKQFCEDITNSTTRRETVEAFNGEASQAWKDTSFTILQNQYPEFLDAMPTKNDLSDMFQNIGLLMPIEVRDTMRTFLESIPEDDDLPANPSLCATPEDLEDFKQRQCLLLEGRATEEDCEIMFNDLQNELLEDMEELTTLLEKGISNVVEDSLPPIVSQPGCDDGIMPFQTEADVKISGNSIDKNMEQLEISYSKDMLGNGGLFAGNDDWGFINMILSDTHGRALSTHRRFSSRDKGYVDVVTQTNLFGVDANNQEGQFPAYVAEWLFQKMKNTNFTFNSNNTQSNINKGKKLYRSFEELGYDGLFGTLDIDLLALPDFGYNSKFSVEMERQRVVIKKSARKKNPDVEMTFVDNNDNRGDLAYNFGFGVKLFLSEVEKTRSPVTGQEIFVNRADDNARVSIVHYTVDRGSILSSPTTVSDRRYEFLSVDDTLSDIDLTNYTNFSKVGISPTKFIPQIQMLSDLMSRSPSPKIKSFHDSTMSLILNTMFQEVAGPQDSNGNPEKNAWKYGAQLDDLKEEDILYVVKNGQTLSPGGTEYADAKVQDIDSDGEESGDRDINNDDMILGISKMQYDEENGSNRENRVFYLDPMVYGGSYARPSIYIKPIQNQGWLGMVDVMFPEAGPCKPQRTDLVNFKEISNDVNQSYFTMPEDQRLKADVDCVVEKPYDRILDRDAKAGIQGVITAAARIYSSVHFIKTLATFTTFNTAVKENYSSLYASYIVEVMEKDFKSAQGSFAEKFNTFKDEEFWYSFLEQSVQTYSRLVAENKITPPESVLRAFDVLNDIQEKYNYPFRDDLKRARSLDRAREFPFQTLKGYREERNFEAIQASEEQAKLILKEFVVMELNKMAEKFNENLKIVGIKPQINDLDFYLLSRFTQGAETLDVDKELKEQIVDMPTEGGNHYTNGGELSQTNGEPYVGYYHIHEDDDGNLVYMKGEAHNDEQHDVLNLFANKVVLPIGDILSINVSPSSARASAKPFVIRKYISINGERLDPDTAVQTIKNNEVEKNISEVYPGTLATVEENGRVVGLTGELGVRYGLVFSVFLDGQLVEITNVEVDALDQKVSQMSPLEGNSKLLFCLIKNLKDDEKFKIFARYVFPLNKFTSTIAIYNDQGFLPSIAQVTAGKGADSFGGKPGIKAYTDEITGQPLSIVLKEGWEHYEDRTKGLYWTWGYRTWDEWDKELLRNSRSRIKKLFKGYYYDRKFEESIDSLTGPGNAGKIIVENLKSNLSLPPGTGLLPWWQRGRLLKTTPFNGKGKLCTKNDD